MNPFYVWIIAYAAPALIAGGVVKALPRPARRPNPRNTIITHATLILSGFLGQYFLRAAGLFFPWFPGVFSISAYALSLVVAFLVIGRGGILYGLSAFIQQFSMLSISFLLLPVFPLWAVILLIVPLFVWCHTMETEHALVRTLLFSAWGVLSILLFHVLQDIYIVAALHAVFGVFLVSRGMLYPREEL